MTAALDHFRQHPGIRLVITDLHMRDGNGMELARRLRSVAAAAAASPPTFSSGASTPGPGPVIIGLSGAVEQDVAEQCKKAGMDAFLSKPVPRSLLLQVVTRWLLDRDSSLPTTGEFVLSPSTLAALAAVASPSHDPAPLSP
eukprot:RCo048300